MRHVRKHPVTPIKPRPAAVPTVEEGVMLRLQLPHTLMQEIEKFQTKMNLYHSVGAIRYLLHRALMWEECLENSKRDFRN
jgi:hypothetical protein